MERFYSMNWSAWTTWLQEFQHQFNLGSPGGLQAMETVSEPLCSREGTSIIQIKKCWSTDEEILGKFPLDCNSYQLNLFFQTDYLPFFYCCSSTVISIFPPSYPSLPPTLDPTPLWLYPCILYTCSLMTLPLFSHYPLRLLSVCSLFQCLWLYFVCLIVLLIRWEDSGLRTLKHYLP